MKKKSASRSAFFNSRVLIGFVLCSAGVLLALVGLNKSVTGMVRHEMTMQTSGSWTSTGSLNVGRRGGFTATLLSNGKVLLAGGCIENPEDPYCNGSATTSAELYDPSTGNWTPTGSMLTPRQGHTATLLADGKVLVAGGQLQACLSNSSAELYDPNTGQWTATGSMNSPRSRHFATLITSGSLQGMVLAGGGYINQNDGGCSGTAQLATAELYDPATGLWSPTTDLTKARDYPIASALPDGSVLVIGTLNCCPYHWFNSAESYNPDTGLWTRTSSRTTAANGAETALLDGKLIVVGGTKGTQPTSVNVLDAELFDPATGGWTGTADMSTDRAGHSLTLLENGQVLVAGGFSGGWGVCNDLKSAELYDPNSGTWSLTGNMTIARNSHTATLLPSGQVLVASGTDCAGRILSSAELYTPATTNEDCMPPPAGLVSWWSGDRTADDVQGANPGVLLGGASFKKGMVGPAFVFDGIDDVVDIPNSTSLSQTRITIDAWVFVTGKQGFARHIISKDNGGTSREYILGIGGENSFVADVWLASGLVDLRNTTTAQLNTWYHIAMTHDGLKLRLYVNGLLDGSADAVGNIVPTGNPVGIGGNTFAPVFFKGIVDEAQIFNRVLTDAEILAIYQAGSAGQCKPEIFVSSIDPSYSLVHSHFLVSTSVAIQDTNGIGSSGATVKVKVRFPSGSQPIFPVTTDESGNASFSFYTSETGLYTFKVIRVAHPTRDYDPSLNIETSDTLLIP